MASEDRRFEKGFFTRRRLPASDKYVKQPGRGPLFLAGAAGALAIGAVFLASAFLGGASMVTHGPLSANHALFARDCAACHVPFEGAVDAQCLTCHQKFGSEIGHYTFERHYLYRSGDPDRSAPSTQELSCAACHREHEGTESSLSRVADAQCRSCHEFGSFARGHPEFEFARSNVPDPANLRFGHTMHVREMMEEYDLVDVEDACLQCHTPEPTGRHFQPISFADQCDACHLSQAASTPFLPLRSGTTGGAGVMTLSQISAAGGPGALWADHWNPNEFTSSGGQVRKRPVYHADPWIMHNLRQLRRDLYPGAGLADLLPISADMPPGEARVFVMEAAATLREQIRAIQGEPSPDVQAELTRLRNLLSEVERRADRPLATLDASRFGVSIADRAPTQAMDGPELEAYQTVVDSLTAACQACHIVERATIRRVQTDQRTLVRAEFDHRAHVIHARCLDCHSAIPMREYLAADEDPPEELDHAGIVNLPGIETCLSCHAGQGPATGCVSCHLFHPDKDHWANLSRSDRRNR